MLFVFFITLINSVFSIFEKEAHYLGISNDIFPTLKKVHTLSANLCTFPFEFNKKFYYDCVPETIQAKTNQITLFWCYTFNRLTQKLEKEYCANQNKIEEKKILVENFDLNNYTQIIKNLTSILGANITEQISKKCGQLKDLKQNISLSMKCIKNIILEKMQRSDLSLDQMKQIISIYNYSNQHSTENPPKKIDLELSVLNQEKFKKFKNFLFSNIQYCDRTCLNYLHRILKSDFSQKEIQILKEEVFFQLTKQLNPIEERKSSIYQHELDEDNIKYPFEYWNDHVIIKKLFKLFLDKDLSSEKFKEEQKVEISKMFYPDYDKIREYSKIYSNSLMIEMEEIEKEFTQIYQEIIDYQNTLQNISRLPDELEKNLYKLQNESWNLEEIFKKLKQSDKEIEELKIDTSKIELQKESNLSTYFEKIEKKKQYFLENIEIFEDEHFSCQVLSPILIEYYLDFAYDPLNRVISNQNDLLFEFEKQNFPYIRILTSIFFKKGQYQLKIISSNFVSIILRDSFINLNDDLESEMIIIKEEGFYETEIRFLREKEQMESKLEVLYKSEEEKYFHNFSREDLCYSKRQKYFDCQSYCRFSIIECRNEDKFIQNCVRFCNIFDWSLNQFKCIKQELGMACLLDKQIYEKCGLYNRYFQLNPKKIYENIKNPNELLILSEKKDLYFHIDSYWLFLSGFLKIYNNLDPYIIFNFKNSLFIRNLPSISDNSSLFNISKYSKMTTEENDFEFYQIGYICSIPETNVFKYKLTYLHLNSLVYSRTRFIFKKIPAFLNEFYYFKTEPYFTVEKLKFKEPTNIFLAMELPSNYFKKPNLDFLSLIEGYQKEKWVVWPKMFDEQNILEIDYLDEQVNRNVTSCFLVNKNDKKINCSLKEREELEQGRKFVLINKKIMDRSEISIKENKFMVILFAKSINCIEDFHYCLEKKDFLSISSATEKEENENSGFLFFDEIKTNLNDCMFGLEKNHYMYIRRNISEKT